MNLDELFWKSSVEDIKRGYVYDEVKEQCTCLLCGENFEEGVIYEFDKKLMEARKAVCRHIAIQHGSVFEYLINMDKKYTGLTEIQKSLAESFYNGVPDKELMKVQGSSASTIRTQRFALREKAKQAKIYLSIIDLMEKGVQNGEEKNSLGQQELIEIHRGAMMVDERYAITKEEKENTLKTYFSSEDKLRLKSFPSRAKKKIIVLQRIAEMFEVNRRYPEVMVNTILKNIFEDYVTIRRYLIEYGFMERTKDCSEYWIKK